MTFRLPPVLDERELPRPVLRAAVLDGELWPIGDGYCLADVPVDAAIRARSLRSVGAEGRVIADRTAAWVWGVVPELSLPRSTVLPRTPVAPHSTGAVEPGIRCRIARLRVGDVARPGGIAVTSPARTAIDLACRAVDEVADEILIGLIELAGTSARALRADLAGRSRLRGRRLGLARLQLLVTR